MPPTYPRFKQPGFDQPQPGAQEKIVSSLCYLSFGLAGLLYIIFSGRHSQSQFFRYNFLQAIFLWIICTLLGWTEVALSSVLGGILGLAGSGGNNIMISTMSAIGLIFGLIIKISYLLMLYGFIWALLGKNCEIPFVSKIVRQQQR